MYLFEVEFGRSGDANSSMYSLFYVLSNIRISPLIGIFLVDCNVEDSRGNFEANPPQVLIDPNEDDADDPDLQVVEESEAKWARVNGFLPSFLPFRCFQFRSSLSLSQKPH